MKAIIWREEYEHIPSVLDSCITDDIKDTRIRYTLKYSMSLDLLRERSENIEPDRLSDSTDHFIQSCLYYSAVVKQLDNPETYVSSLFKETVTSKDIRGIQVCLRAAVDVKKDDIIDCLKEAVRRADGFTVVKAITNIIVLSTQEIVTIIEAKDGKDRDSDFNENDQTSQLLLGLKQKSIVLESFIKDYHKNLIDAYFGVRKIDDEDKQTIVAIFKIPPFKELEQYQGYNLEYRHDFSAYSESIEAEYGGTHDNPGGLIKFKPVISKYIDYLMRNQRNLNIVRGSTVRSRQKSGTFKGQNCILFSCYVKGVIPDGDLEFPSTLNGISVDVREGAFHLYAGTGNTRSFSSFSTLKMGRAIGKTGMFGLYTL